MPTKYGYFRLNSCLEKKSKLEHIVLIKGDIKSEEIVLTRIHSAYVTGDLFGLLRCDCGEQLIHAINLIEKEGRGVIIYLQQEGRVIGLMNKIKAYKLQEEGLDTVDANIELGFDPHERDYLIASEILRNLGVSRVRLLTNNPKKY